MRKNILALLTASTIGASALVVSQGAVASNGGGFNQGGFSQQRIDQLYELGKSYYKSPQANGSRLEYCVKNGDSLSKISRKSVSRFKRGPASEFVNSLYSCSDSSLKIADAIADGQGEAVLYYLNKRFKLRLTNS